MRNKLKFILIIMILLIMNVKALAKPFSSISLDGNVRREELRREINGYKDERGIIDRIEDEIENMYLAVEHYDTKIKLYLDEIETVDNEICSMENEINKISNEINYMNDKLELERAKFYKRVREMYMNGDVFYIEILFESKGIVEVYDNIGALQCLVKYNDKMISNLVNKENDLKQLRQKHDEDLASLMSLKSRKEDRIYEFEKAKEDQKKIIVKAKERKEYYISILPSYRNRMDEKQRQIENVTISIAALANQRENKFYSRGENEISPSDVVAYSAKFLGKPYEWGAVGPNSFDCSGYVKYVYSYFGIELKRTTYEQYIEGVHVSKDELRQGDLVFFGYGIPNHVGIYLGNDCYIHAPTSGDYVRVSHLSRSDYFGARRLF